MRDKKWFEYNLPTFERMWNYIEIIRQDNSKRDSLKSYIDYATNCIKSPGNKIMNFIESLCNNENTEDIPGMDTDVEDDEVDDGNINYNLLTI